VLYRIILVSLLWAACWPPSLAAEDLVARADALCAWGGMQNYQEAIDLYLRFAADHPKDFDAQWKCARALREYGEKAKRQEQEDWKTICVQAGKTGMDHSEKAIELEPDRPEGHYYYGLNAGIYSDGKSILAAMKEGLKNKTQRRIEKAYAIDKMYAEAGPIVIQGRFWAVLPWPLTDKKKSLQYYREYQATPYFEGNVEGQIYLAELLIDMGGKKNKAEARRLLEGAARTEEAYFKEWAERLLAELP
jgi:hypothetical protein